MDCIHPQSATCKQLYSMRSREVQSLVLLIQSQRKRVHETKNTAKSWSIQEKSLMIKISTVRRNQGL